MPALCEAHTCCFLCLRQGVDLSRNQSTQQIRRQDEWFLNRKKEMLRNVNQELQHDQDSKGVKI